MALKTILGIGILITCCLMEVSSRPNNESTKIEIPLDESQDESDKGERSITFTQDPSLPTNSGNMRDIIEKIQAVNDGLKKTQKPQPNSYKAPPLPESYVVDKELLEKIQQIIASGKIKTTSEMNKHHENNFINEDVDDNRKEHSKALQMLSTEINPQSMPFTAIPYIMNVPLVVMPYGNNNMKYPNMDFNSMQSNENFQTRQGQPSPFPSFPSFGTNFQWPFQLQWPFANFFPLIIKDPFIALQQGGGWNNFFENGQVADVCARKQKSIDNEIPTDEVEIKRLLKVIETIINRIPKENSPEREVDEAIDPVSDMNHRQDRALKKRTVASSAPSQEIESSRKTQNLYIAKPVVTRKPPKKIFIEAEIPEDTKTNAAEGDLRFPFGGFDWFGNKKPVAPSPGFFINRLRVRKGGVAIAGPGGVATAGRGGTAIVGPGGLAYTQPGGLAVAGPAARVVALSSETDLNSVVTRLRQLNDTSLPLSKQPIREGKVVATGPVIYYHPNEQTASVQYLPFYGGAKGQYLEIKKDNRGTVLSEKIVAEDSISSENIIKNSNENLLLRVLTANLQNLKTISTNLLRLNNLGRKVGLNASDKARFKSQLTSLAEAASNTIKLVEEVGDDVSVLFKSNATLRRYDDADEEDVGEEGIGIDNPEDTGDNFDISGTIAEAKPVGLAVIGDHGLAASRPMATAVAQHGVALARPIATAIAGLDPTALGIEFHINHHSRAKARNQ